MTTVEQPDISTSEVLQVVAAYHQAMISADISTLENLLSNDYTLTHITGYIQSRQDWFSVVAAGDFDYHHIRIEGSLEVAVQDHTAAVKGKGIFHATIQGANAPWRLMFTLSLVKHERSWQIAQAKYASY